MSGANGLELFLFDGVDRLGVGEGEGKFAGEDNGCGGVEAGEDFDAGAIVETDLDRGFFRFAVGREEGKRVGSIDGSNVGIAVGSSVGSEDGSSVGAADGSSVGLGVGMSEGTPVGSGVMRVRSSFGTL